MRDNISNSRIDPLAWGIGYIVPQCTDTLNLSFAIKQGGLGKTLEVYRICGYRTPFWIRTPVPVNLNRAPGKTPSTSNRTSSRLERHLYILIAYEILQYLVAKNGDKSLFKSNMYSFIEIIKSLQWRWKCKISTKF